MRRGSNGIPRSEPSLGIGALLLAAVVWGVFVSPRAPVAPPRPLSLVLQALIFGSAAAALAYAGHHALAVVFLALVVINAGLIYAWG